MMELDILNWNEAKPTGDKVKLPQEWEGLKINRALLHEVIRWSRCRQRAGTACTKTRGEVQGSGHKPWKQKHTGRARAGSTSSPLWKGGGIIFGPKPRDFSIRIPSAKRSKALAHALCARSKQELFFVAEKDTAQVSKTKEVSRFLQTLGLEQGPRGRALFVTASPSLNFLRAGRNLAQADIVSVENLNTYQVLKASFIVMTDAAWAKFLETKYHGI